MEIEILVFACEQRHFGINAKNVSEVLRAVALAPVPQATDQCMGLLNLRGRLIPVLDMKHTLGIGHATLRSTDHFVVVSVSGGLVALHVDKAVDLVRLDLDPAKDASPDGQEIDSADTPLIHTVAKTHFGIVQVISVDRLVAHPTVQKILATAALRSASELTL